MPDTCEADNDNVNDVIDSVNANDGEGEKPNIHDLKDSKAINITVEATEVEVVPVAQASADKETLPPTQTNRPTTWTYATIYSHSVEQQVNPCPTALYGSLEEELLL